MKVVAAVSQKGGAGKTTLCTELAVAAVSAGYRTIVFDLDPQASAGHWGDDRAGAAPQVLAVPSSRLKVFLDQAAQQGADLLFLDTAPHASQIGVDAARAADLVLIPCKPSPRDAKAIGTSLSAVVDLTNTPAFVVVNEAKTGTSMIRMMDKALREAGVKVCPVKLGDRVAFVTALVTGQTATEYEPHGKAAGEVQKMWKWLARELGIPANRETVQSSTRKTGKASSRKSANAVSRVAENT